MSTLDSSSNPQAPEAGIDTRIDSSAAAPPPLRPSADPTDFELELDEDAPLQDPPKRTPRPTSFELEDLQLDDPPDVEDADPPDKGRPPRTPIRKNATMPEISPADDEPLDCPFCGYSLSGLDEEWVRCPECGEMCSKPLIRRRLQLQPVGEAPGMEELAAPAWPAAGVVILTIMCLTTMQHPYPAIPWLAGGFAVFSLITWLERMKGAYDVFGRLQGLTLSLQLQMIRVIEAGVLLSLITFVCVGVTYLAALASRQPGGYTPIVLAAALGLALGLAALRWLCHPLYRNVVDACRKRWITVKLRDRPTG